MLVISKTRIIDYVQSSCSYSYARVLIGSQLHYCAALLQEMRSTAIFPHRKQEYAVPYKYFPFPDTTFCQGLLLVK